MSVLPVAAGRRPPPGSLLRMSALLSCGAAALTWGAPPQGAVVRQQPEEKLFSTGPQSRFRALLYAPKAPETDRSAVAPVIFYSGEWGWRPLQQLFPGGVYKTQSVCWVKCKNRDIHLFHHTL